MTTSPERPDSPDSLAAPDAPAAPEPPRLNIEERAEAFGQRAESLGREAEAAAERFSSSPAVKETADVASRVWGLVLLAFGLWFLADVTLHVDMPAVAWRDLWPLVLIVFGGIIVLRGMTRRA